MTMKVDYTFAPTRARPGMAYGQYNQIATYSTGANGVKSGAVVSYADGTVTNGGAIPVGIVVDSVSLLGLGFADQYVNSCCSVLEQGKAWALTKDGKTFAINDPVAYDPLTGELDPAGTEISGWVVVGGTHDNRTLVQVIPMRKTDTAPAQSLQGAKKPSDKTE
ncbi:hypothetical protein [Lelliottia wanjuensis]|uniref:hypothetical protein n=1 Tax=Lelliottia wanjuensis TaxID=3050585 RepID=UPI00254E48D1|nr:hypothetical protein [Lelliottia sp. V104_15]MDK9607104.1 hypothetical protein [Lelliottia sp. V104_15]